MSFRSLTYYIKEAVIGLVRNRIMALASIVTVMSCIFIVSLSFCIAVNVDYILEQMESSLNLSVYIKDDLSPEIVPILHEKVLAIKGVKDVSYVSSDEALATFKERLGDDDKHLLDGLEFDNPMPRSFVVTLTDVRNQDYVISEIAKLQQDGVDEVKYDQQIVNIITSLNTGIRVISIVVILGLIIVSIVIIINTIKITVNNRRTEITIMKYIGATDWFIRWPFIFEGVLIGVIGAIIPVTLSWISYSGTIDSIYTNMKMLQNLVEFRSAGSVFIFLFPITLTIGVFVGVLGSVTSLRRYLKA